MNRNNKEELDFTLTDIENGNIKSGMDSLIRLATQGEPEAEYILGHINEFNIHNYKEAAKWYLLAAEHGQPNAQRNISDLYIVGKGVEVNNKEAIKWYVKAAEQGVPESQFVLGEYYRTGVFVNKNTDIARKYYTMSANNGYEPAKIRLEQLKPKDVNPSILQENMSVDSLQHIKE